MDLLQVLQELTEEKIESIYLPIFSDDGEDLQYVGKWLFRLCSLLWLNFYNGISTFSITDMLYVAQMQTLKASLLTLVTS